MHKFFFPYIGHTLYIFLVKIEIRWQMKKWVLITKHYMQQLFIIFKNEQGWQKITCWKIFLECQYFLLLPISIDLPAKCYRIRHWRYKDSHSIFKWIVDKGSNTNTFDHNPISAHLTSIFGYIKWPWQRHFRINIIILFL